MSETDLSAAFYDFIDKLGDQGYTVPEMREAFEASLANWSDGFDDAFHGGTL